MSLANLRLVKILPPMLAFPSYSSGASDIIFQKILKRVGERGYPSLGPFFSHAVIHLD